jgi:hypothetical protein
MVIDPNLVIALAIIVLLAVVAIALMTRKRRSEHLASRFGPEYERTVHEMGSRSRAESELAAREKRVQKLTIVPLPPQDAQRFRMDWQALQARFVDNPGLAVAEADNLVREVMSRRGYPMGDFESQAADISVDHPVVVEHYRAAHAIAQRQRRGEVDTEALRQGLVHYRALFTELLETAPEPATAAQAAPAQRTVRDERTVEAPGRGGFLRPDRAMAREEAQAREREREIERRNER